MRAGLSHRAALGIVLAVAIVDRLAAEAPAPSVTFAGESYFPQHAASQPGGRLTEYVRAGESLENWTRLVAVHHFPALVDPASAAAGVVRELHKVQPGAKFQLLTKDDRSEALVDFLAFLPDNRAAEFNAFRYRRLPGVPGLVAYQFAYRFRLGDLAAADAFPKQRQAWLDALLAADWPLTGAGDQTPR